MAGKKKDFDDEVDISLYKSHPKIRNMKKGLIGLPDMETVRGREYLAKLDSPVGKKLKKEMRGKNYRGQGDVITSSQEEERAEKAKNKPTVKKAMGGVLKNRGGTFKGTY